MAPVLARIGREPVGRAAHPPLAKAPPAEPDGARAGRRLLAPLTADEQAHLRRLVGRVLARQEPFFAVAIDHRWDVLMANEPAEATLRGYVDEGGVPGPRNLLRLTLVMDFANPLDPAMDEIRLETFLPADDESARILEAGAGP